MLGLPPRGQALGPGGRLGRSGRGSGRLCDRSWPTDPWPWRSRALAWGLPLRSAAPRRPKPRLRVVRSPRWPPRSPGRDAPLGGGPGAFPCQRGRWRRRRRTRLPSPAGRGARRPLGAPWKRPPPRKPPCALMDHTWHLLGLLWPVLADAGSLPTCLGEALATVRGLFGPGPEPVCRARPVDSTTADKIQGPELLRAPACSLTSLIASQQELRRA